MLDIRFDYNTSVGHTSKHVLDSGHTSESNAGQ